MMVDAGAPREIISWLTPAGTRMFSTTIGGPDAVLYLRADVAEERQRYGDTLLEAAKDYLESPPPPVDPSQSTSFARTSHKMREEKLRAAIAMYEGRL